MSLSTLRNHQLYAIPNRCWFNSASNRISYQNVYGMNLRWVVGAVKYHTKEKTLVGNGFMDEGKTLRTSEDLKTNWDDTHAWLEDEEGNVYDCIMEDDNEEIMMYDPYKKKWKMNAGFIEGNTYQSLRSRGYELIPYPEESREVVKDMLIEKYSEYTDLVALIRSVDMKYVDVY